jgi:aspartokinase/homoserine dehydrogenase 1
VHKFGGSSLADARCFRRVADIVLGQPDDHRLAVVVSAMGGMTDALLALVARAELGDAEARGGLDELESRFETVAGCLLDPPSRREVLQQWYRDRADLADLLHAVALIRSAPQRTHDVVAGYGELWSSRLLAAYLTQRLCEQGSTRKIGWLDARDVVTVHQTKLGASVLWPISRERCASAAALQTSDICVITGFIAVDEAGLQTTLGRNGSDHSAAIFGALLGADNIVIWTDVAGVMSGDPRRVPESRVIGELSYNEAMELAYFGAKVIHPQTMGPAVSNDIPIYIRSTFAPEQPGSCVSQQSGSADPIKGITSIDGIAIVNVEGAGMIGVPGTADRIFRALREADVSVVLISQASSEHSICFAVPEAAADEAQRVVSRAFQTELEEGQIQRVDVTAACSIVAVVGDRMSGTPGVAGRFLNTLGRAGINVIAIAQGSSERNISAVVPSADATRALRAVHSGFYLSAKTLSIGLIGPGTVGGTFLAQLERQSARLRERFNLDLRVRAIATSREMLLGDRRIELGEWRESLRERGEPADLDRLAAHVHADHLPHAVIIDCTASDAIADRYEDWLRRGIHIITPNKKAFSGELDRYRRLEAAARAGNASYFYETTVGAALPVIQTLRDLRQTGDRVASVEGIFSGTLAYLFNTWDGNRPFSDVVREARDAGYTEPDPRDDLSGLDVARKVVILARELGHDLQLESLDIESLVPDALAGLSVDDFLERLPEADADIKARLDTARASEGCLRYIGRLTADGQATVRLEVVPLDHPFARINLTDNVVQFVSERYSDNPLVIQGPGAGPDVTAGGVFADLFRLAAQLGMQA